MSKKIRIDVLLTEKKYFDSREKAKRALMAGNVLVNNVIVDKAGAMVEVDAEIRVKERDKYVSRGGFKLEKSIAEFGLVLDDKICMDIGSSTGGFTDCMLQNGASKVYSVDVGYGQLDWKLRSDDRVVVMERCNFRNLDTDTIEESIDFFSVDVSFISLKHIFPNIRKLSNDDSQIVTLVKPQFEAGREKVGKHGVVRDSNVHIEVIQKVVNYARENGLFCKSVTFSPIKGAKGNIEYLALFTTRDDNIEIDAEKIVNFALNELNN
ncbi:23S rRNA (cytidine1920-2'-O)/16S rRNA (cytidine1409-2'-O)-methyltransferase [Dethiosulfatibacter aminovorans DSM 17477]|uniref:23S rRNA (Cytidine1920-2'-O)/16S rRNA (Cytidine1409-2'-O)-methyltransferase n=1 Tax=Dethiosulfatibacter aminovorans DSM 17477 TaxID=1121476 RepID=A0A1M6D9H4_9FIRM|nr:TlyA family RNA methyltransferase [Dethiosulfatibacter aminovorans]SHI69811.1 23S rRNA (cytidine1920-2'-O)/16S rRNA (cytidine1409-2'-O)-methyltransferase [Dethiosulfatibacter aminovorans DSM 17477]